MPAATSSAACYKAVSLVQAERNRCCAPSSEVETKRQLPGSVARIFRCRCRRQLTKGHVVDLSCRWCEVGVVEHVGKGRLKPQMHAFRNRNDLGQPQGHCRRSWALQDANTRVAEAPRTRWSGTKCVHVEIVIPCLTLVEVLRDGIRPQEGAAVGDVGIG